MDRKAIVTWIDGVIARLKVQIKTVNARPKLFKKLRAEVERMDARELTGQAEKE